MFSGCPPKIRANVGRIERAVLLWIALWMSLGSYTVFNDALAKTAKNSYGVVLET